MSNNPLVLWDVDGTLSDSFQLGFDSTNAVLQRNGKDRISTESYHQGTKFTTPRRMAWHVTGDPDHPIGEELVYFRLQPYAILYTYVYVYFEMVKSEWSPNRGGNLMSSM